MGSGICKISLELSPISLSHEVIKRSTVIAECVIAPEMTRMLEVAKETGRAGVPMLAAQMNLMLQFMGVERPFSLQ